MNFSYILLLCLILLIPLYYFLLPKDTITTQNFDLNKDGLIKISNVLSPNEIEYLNTCTQNGNYKDIKKYIHQHPKILDKIMYHTSKDYEFQDYIWLIKKSSVHTCHRDNNGDFFNKGQKYPSYTMLIYLKHMPSALGVIPKSHLKKNRYKNWFNIIDPLVHVECKPGDIILFNANLIHVGTINKEENHPRIQLKVTHHNDRNIIKYYENFNKILVKDNLIPRWIRNIQRRGSCMVPLLSDYLQNENIRSSGGTDKGVKIGIGQKIFSALYYGDSHFYDLPNAF